MITRPLKLSKLYTFLHLIGRFGLYLIIGRPKNNSKTNINSEKFAELKKFLNQLESLNNDYINFKKNAHTLTGKDKKFQNFIKKALDRLNEPYLKSHQTLFPNTESTLDVLSTNMINNGIKGLKCKVAENKLGSGFDLEMGENKVIFNCRSIIQTQMENLEIIQ